MGEPALYSDMLETAKAELRPVVGSEHAKDVAQRIARKFCTTHKDKTYRVPALQAMLTSERNAALFADSETMSVKELAKKYDLATNHVYILLKSRDCGVEVNLP